MDAYALSSCGITARAATEVSHSPFAFQRNKKRETAYPRHVFPRSGTDLLLLVLLIRTRLQFLSYFFFYLFFRLASSNHLAQSTPGTVNS
jgi:hypothetical protein